MNRQAGLRLRIYRLKETGSRCVRFIQSWFHRGSRPGSAGTKSVAHTFLWAGDFFRPSDVFLVRPLSLRLFWFLRGRRCGAGQQFNRCRRHWWYFILCNMILINWWIFRWYQIIDKSAFFSMNAAYGYCHWKWWNTFYYCSGCWIYLQRWFMEFRFNANWISWRTWLIVTRQTGTIIADIRYPMGIWIYIWFRDQSVRCILWFWCNRYSCHFFFIHNSPVNARNLGTWR